MPSPPFSALQQPAVLIVGGSVRFLASSCQRAGWQVYAADRFGDADLLAIAAEHRPLPSDLIAAGDPFPELPRIPFLFSGGLEHAAAFLERLDTTKTRAAACPAAVQAARDINQLATEAAAAGLQVPDTHSSPEGLPTDGSFLVKPRDSVGGQGIAGWRGGSLPSRPSRWQRVHAGIPHGVSLLLAGGQPPQLLGVCRSLRCAEATAAPGWAYSGSVTVAAPAWVSSVLVLADRLARRHGLHGAVGIDCIVEPSGRVMVLEVNPRPTASMELHERTQGMSIARQHLAAFGIPSPCLPSRLQGSRPTASGKAILYATDALTLSPSQADTLTELSRRWAGQQPFPAVADLPSVGSPIDAGSPVLTVFADGPSSDVVDERLAQRLAQLREILRQPAIRRGMLSTAAGARNCI